MITLKKVTRQNVFDLMKLEVYSNQKDCVAENYESIAEAYVALTENDIVYPFGIYDGNKAVGFLMIGYGVDKSWKDAPEVLRNSYSLWRLMIDKKYQRKGYGRKAIELALDFIRTWPNGKAEYCYLSYMPENVLAKNLYHSFGFVETGDKDDDEIIAILKL